MTKIHIGMAVRSWDSERRGPNSSWVDGVVEGIADYLGEGCLRYAIRVIADYRMGKPVTLAHSRVGTLVYAPQNGSRGMFTGEVADGVIPFPTKEG